MDRLDVEDRRVPETSASATRCFADVTGRTSPARLISPNAASSCGTALSRIAARDGDGDREVGAGLGEPHAADGRDVDVVLGAR